MHVIILQYGVRMYWRIFPDDPPAYDVYAYPGVQFISPLLYLGLEDFLPFRPFYPLKRIIGWFDGAYLVESEEIAFVVADPDKYKLPSEDLVVRLLSRATPFGQISSWLLNSLRHLSKQIQIPTSGEELNTWDWIEIDTLPMFTPFVKIKGEYAVAATIIDTAIRREHIEQACSKPADFRPPIFSSLFLDAIEAHNESDYRRSILYAAMTVETVAATVLDSQFEEKLTSGDDLRLIRLNQADGATVIKDPIWERLRERDDFGSLLHEAPLYLLRRSILLENEALFQEAKMLYATRNQIVHRGEPPATKEAKYLPIDLQGSSRALLCVLDIFRWFGVPDSYPLPHPGFVPVTSTPPYDH